MKLFLKALDRHIHSHRHRHTHTTRVRKIISSQNRTLKYTARHTHKEILDISPNDSAVRTTAMISGSRRQDSRD